ncbi:NADP-dependent oxidoreductase domain-containing protein [Lipomyces kononenkoae]|uniref:NADP-dependent oxidoreductase domain-containing protein n=1 Tax=Lipomyces kononenkoae TaxID=34357 RepID=A0ACC3SXT1_LIPKO
MAPIATKQLGKFGPRVPALGFGAMGISTWYGKIDDDETRLRVLDRAYELGITFWDTADIYGDSEELLGKWFKRTGKRDEIFLATKFGSLLNAGDYTGFRSDPEYARECCDRSLKRLGVDYIDLFYCHRLDGKTPIEDTVEAMVGLKRGGKIKYLGLSEMSAESLRRACAVHHIDAVQMEYSPFALDIEYPEIGILKACRELGVAVVCYSPLGRGFMTGRYNSPDDFDPDDLRRIMPRFAPENFSKNLEVVAQFKALAQKNGCTPAQLCLAFLMAQGDHIIPIPGTRSVKYLEDNAGALNIALPPAALTEIRRALEATEVAGARYPEMLKHSCYVDTPPRNSPTKN